MSPLGTALCLPQAPLETPGTGVDPMQHSQALGTDTPQILPFLPPRAGPRPARSPAAPFQLEIPQVYLSAPNPPRQSKIPLTPG